MLTDILMQLSTTAVVITIAGWFLKTWISHQFENFQTKHAHNLALKLEAARSEWAKEVARLNVHENYLHTRRVALIERETKGSGIFFCNRARRKLTRTFRFSCRVSRAAARNNSEDPPFLFPPAF
jgi:hypothetical protein